MLKTFAPQPTKIAHTLQRKRASNDNTRAVGNDKAPPIVDEVLRSPGQSLSQDALTFFEPRFGRDFSDVRMHTNARAAASAAAVDATAYTLGRHIVFDSDRYAPGTAAGQRLLAHELTHVVQQRGGDRDTPLQVGNAHSSAEQEADAIAQRMTGEDDLPAPSQPAAPDTLQRQTPEEDERRRRPTAEASPGPFQLRPPVLGENLGFRPPRVGIDVPQLRLDPQIEAQIRAMQIIKGVLSISSISQALDSLSLAGLTPPTAAPALPGLSPQAPPIPAPQPASTAPLPTAVPQPAPPLVTPGAGPATPRPAEAGDVLKAVLQIPAVNTAVTALQNEAERRVRTDFNSLSTGEKALVITQGVVIGGGALAGVLSNREGRQFVLEQIQGRAIPVPGLPLTLQLDNLTGADKRFQLNLDVGALLPPQLGFGPKK